MSGNLRRNTCSAKALLYSAVIPSIAVASSHGFYFSLFPLPVGISPQVLIFKKQGPEQNRLRHSSPWTNYLCLGEAINFDAVVQLWQDAPQYSHPYTIVPEDYSDLTAACFSVRIWPGFCSNYGTIPAHWQHLLFTVCSAIFYCLQAAEQRYRNCTMGLCATSCLW